MRGWGRGISHFQYYYKIPDKCNVKYEGLVYLAYGLRVQTIMVGESWKQELEAERPIASAVRNQEREEC